MLTKRNGELESQLHCLERRQHSNQTGIIGGIDVMDGHTERRVKELEKLVQSLQQEKEDVIKEKGGLADRFKSQEKDLEEVVHQRKLAMDEYTEVSDKLSELRTFKQKLTRSLRDKEESLETALQKIDLLKQDLRKTEKSRREIETQLQDHVSDVVKVVYYICNFKEIMCNTIII